MSQHEQICYHEAGHVVAAVASGLPVLGVNIDANGYGLARVDVDGWPPYDVCLMIMCGPAAQARWCALHGETHADPDWEWSDKQAIAKLVAGPALTPDWNAAHELVAAYWTQIERVARALANTNTLSREDVIRVVRGNSHPENPMTVPLSVSNAPRRALAAAPKPSPRARLCEALDLAPNATPAQIVAAVQAAFHADDPIDALERVRRALGLPEYASAVDSLKAIESLLGVRIASTRIPGELRVKGCLHGAPSPRCNPKGCGKLECAVAPLRMSRGRVLTCLSRAKPAPADVDTGAALELAEGAYAAARNATARAKAEYEAFIRTPWSEQDTRLEVVQLERAVLVARQAEDSARRAYIAARLADAVARGDAQALAVDVDGTIAEVSGLVAEESPLREQIAELTARADALRGAAQRRLADHYHGSLAFQQPCALPTTATGGLDLRDPAECVKALRRAAVRKPAPPVLADELAAVDAKICKLAAEREIKLSREEAQAKAELERKEREKANALAVARAAQERIDREAREAELNAAAERELAAAYARRTAASA